MFRKLRKSVRHERFVPVDREVECVHEQINSPGIIRSLPTEEVIFLLNFGNSKKMRKHIVPSRRMVRPVTACRGRNRQRPNVDFRRSDLSTTRIGGYQNIDELLHRNRSALADSLWILTPKQTTAHGKSGDCLFLQEDYNEVCSPRGYSLL